jgi:hypothetical protein
MGEMPAGERWWRSARRRFLKGFQLVDDLVLRRLQVTDCKGSRHGCEDADHRSYGNSYEQPYGSRREASVRLLGHEGSLKTPEYQGLLYGQPVCTANWFAVIE